MPNRVIRGDVIDVALDPTIGTEIQKARPCVVVQNDVTNKISRKTIIVPLTSAQPKKPYPAFVVIPRVKVAFKMTVWPSATRSELWMNNGLADEGALYRQIE